jgi:hypothetical protein
LSLRLAPLNADAIALSVLLAAVPSVESHAADAIEALAAFGWMIAVLSWLETDARRRRMP